MIECENYFPMKSLPKGLPTTEYIFAFILTF